MFFFASTAESRQSNLLKTCFGQNEQVWMDEKLVTIFRVLLRKMLGTPFGSVGTRFL